MFCVVCYGEFAAYRLSASSLETEATKAFYVALDLTNGSSDEEDDAMVSLPFCPECHSKVAVMSSLHQQAQNVLQSFNTVRNELAFKIVDTIGQNCRKGPLDLIRTQIFSRWKDARAQGNGSHSSGTNNVPDVPQSQQVETGSSKGVVPSESKSVETPAIVVAGATQHIVQKKTKRATIPRGSQNVKKKSTTTAVRKYAPVVVERKTRERRPPPPLSYAAVMNRRGLDKKTTEAVEIPMKKRRRRRGLRFGPVASTKKERACLSMPKLEPMMTTGAVSSASSSSKKMNKRPGRTSPLKKGIQQMTQVEPIKEDARRRFVRLPVKVRGSGPLPRYIYGHVDTRTLIRRSLKRTADKTKNLSTSVCEKPKFYTTNLNYYNAKAPKQLADGSFKCSFCPITYKDSVTVNQHASRCHPQTRPLLCTLCTKGFLSMDGVRKHLKASHKEEVERSMSCLYCSKKFVKPVSLELHVRTCHAMPTFEEKSSSTSQAQLPPLKRGKKVKNITTTVASTSRTRFGSGSGSTSATSSVAADGITSSPPPITVQKTKKQRNTPSSQPQGGIRIKIEPMEVGDEDEDEDEEVVIVHERIKCSVCDKEVKGRYGLAGHIKLHYNADMNFVFKKAKPRRPMGRPRKVPAAAIASTSTPPEETSPMQIAIIPKDTAAEQQ